MTGDVNNLFQQWCNEFVNSTPGSTDEEVFFSKMIQSFYNTFTDRPELFNPLFVIRFVDEIKRRQNRGQQSKIKYLLATTTSTPIFVGAYYNQKNINELMKDINVLTYPLYQTDAVNTNSRINPYEEFVSYCVDKYFDTFKDIQVNCNDFSSLNATERILLFSRHFGDDVKIQTMQGTGTKKGEFDIEVTQTIDGEEKHICRIAMRESYFIVSDTPKESRQTIYVDFTKNDCFSYLFNQEENIKNKKQVDKELGGSEFVLNELPGTSNEIAMVLCLLSGLLDFGEYKKFHKKNAITINGINSYINGKSNDLSGKLVAICGYDKAILVYTKSEDNKLKDAHSTIVSYKNYVNDIDEFVNELA